MEGGEKAHIRRRKKNGLKRRRKFKKKLPRTENGKSTLPR